MINKYDIVKTTYTPEKYLYASKCLNEELTFEELIRNIENVNIEFLRQNIKISLSEQQFNVLTLMQEITEKNEQASIYIIPTAYKPAKVIFEI